MLPLDITEKREFLVSLLQENTVEVTFTKVNGDQRVMPCTLDPSRLPAQPVSESKDRKRNNENLSVWCTDKNEWRSFKIANVTAVKILAK